MKRQWREGAGRGHKCRSRAGVKAVVETGAEAGVRAEAGSSSGAGARSGGDQKENLSDILPYRMLRAEAVIAKVRVLVSWDATEHILFISCVKSHILTI